MAEELNDCQNETCSLCGGTGFRSELRSKAFQICECVDLEDPEEEIRAAGFRAGFRAAEADTEAELSRLQAEIAEAREIISILAEMEPSSLVEPGSDDDRYTLHLSEKRQAHDVHGDQIRRARAFLEKADG